MNKEENLKIMNEAVRTLYLRLSELLEIRRLAELDVIERDLTEIDRKLDEVNNGISLIKAGNKNESQEPESNLDSVTNRTFMCDRCGTNYNLVGHGDDAGCCVNPVLHRTSNICGGQLILVTE